jgi:hypothetical protein
MTDAYRQSVLAEKRREYAQGTERPSALKPAGQRGREVIGWPVPEDISGPDLPPTPFPLEALGYLLEPATRDIVSGTKCPPALAGASVLAAAAFAAQGLYDVEFVRKSRRPLSLSILTSGVTGERKSTVDRLAMHGAHTHQATLLREYSARAYTISEMKKAGDDPPPAHPDPTIIVNTGTVQGLFHSFAEGRPSQALFNDEGGGFLGGHGFKPENRLATLTALSKFWDGGVQTHKLRGNGHKSETITVADCRLTVHLMAQPVALRPFLADPMARGQGILARCLIHAPPSTIGTRITTWEEWNEDGMTTNILSFGLGVERMLAHSVLKNATGKVERPLLRLREDAGRALHAYSNDVEHQLGPLQALAGFSDLVNKVHEQAVRIAGILAAFRGEDEVSGRTMTDGIALAEYFLSETVRLAKMAPQDGAAKDALTIADWLHERGGKASRVTFSKCGPKHLRRVAARKEAFSLLTAANWMRETNGELELNPRCTALGFVDRVRGEMGE